MWNEADWQDRKKQKQRNADYILGTPGNKQQVEAVRLIRQVCSQEESQTSEGQRIYIKR